MSPDFRFVLACILSVALGLFYDFIPAPALAILGLALAWIVWDACTEPEDNDESAYGGDSEGRF